MIIGYLDPWGKELIDLGHLEAPQGAEGFWGLRLGFKFRA